MVTREDIISAIDHVGRLLAESVREHLNSAHELEGECTELDLVRAMRHESRAREDMQRLIALDRVYRP